MFLIKKNSPFSPILNIWNIPTVMKRELIAKLKKLLSTIINTSPTNLMDKKVELIYSDPLKTP